ncbi:MORN repeat-containing protein 3 [Takifugu flavidus]|uniref:MORN repeat-containing protein 3 n=2 Tax=Takifugu flavidus TaxID=433684 RepID=A0A5C6MXP5_9TELE|nr:MORN repeat-containing protein 3 [Takifugu flavidus]
MKLREEMAKKNGLHHKVFSVDNYSVNEYTGEWLDDKKHGYGTQIWSKTGSMYVGFWKYGKPDGEGTQKVLDPKLKDYIVRYAGHWKNGKKHGMGLYFGDDSTIYDGQWAKDHRNGWGRMYYPNGDVYAGEWLNDLQHGQGIMYYANKNIYVGNWSAGSKDGNGSCYSHSKRRYFEGVWVDGSPTSLQQLSDSEFEARNQNIQSCIEILQMWNPMV